MITVEINENTNPGTMSYQEILNSDGIYIPAHDLPVDKRRVVINGSIRLIFLRTGFIGLPQSGWEDVKFIRVNEKIVFTQK